LDIDQIQTFLKENNISAWLLYDFRGINPIAQSIAGLLDRKITRRWFCYLPSAGKPFWLIHQIELSHFYDIPGEIQSYSSWNQLHKALGQMLTPGSKVAMEYSPNGAIPYISRVDGGTLELIRSFGIDLCSSADLVQLIDARISPDQYTGHLESAKCILQAKDYAFKWIGDQTRQGQPITEYDVQQIILDQFDTMDLITDHPPIVAVNANSSDPHYSPSLTKHKPINQGDFVLIDLWAKQKSPDAIFADTTWTGFVGKKIPDKISKIFDIVRRARDLAVGFITEHIEVGKKVYGYEVDDVVRNFISQHGYGDFFPHRTGHSIGTHIHGNGANIDNYETMDQRLLVPNTCFSIEPGIYLNDFGVRTEIDVFLAYQGKGGAKVTTVPVQNQILRLL